jgi:hypothetical protein
LLAATDLPASVTALISKPFEADELISTLEGALAQPIAAESNQQLAHPG